MITYAQAVEIARAGSDFLGSEGVVIGDGFEDSEDYLIGWEYVKGFPLDRMVNGGGNIFVNKETGAVWAADAPFVWAKVAAMSAAIL
ncbi:hypothetical protein SAMN06298212_10564 [Ruaniaceae bacterium KH17]|nr:hypothetical protein SAMN06298212_10564 [Ruaniaceae bacterium KH17]